MMTLIPTPQNSSTKAYFAYFDYAIVLLAIAANCIVLTAVVRCQLRLTGYRRFLISLSAGDLYICIVNVLTLAYQIFLSTSSTATPSLYPTPPTITNFMSAMTSTELAATSTAGGDMDYSTAMFDVPSLLTHPGFMTSTEIAAGGGSNTAHPDLDDPTRHPAFKCSANVLRTLKLAGFFTNLLNLVGMSIDHFFGVIYPLKYRYFMNKNVARMAVVAIWITAFSLAFLDIPINIVLYYGSLAGNGAQGSHGHQSAGLASPSTMHSPTTTILNLNLPHASRSQKNFSADEIIFQNSFSSSPSFSNNQTSPSIPIAKTNKKRTKPNNQRRTIRSVEELRDILNELDIPTAVIIEEIFNSTNEDDQYIFKAEQPNSPVDFDARQSLSRMLTILRDDEERDKDACTFFSGGKMWFEISIIVLAIVCFTFMTICYGIIFKYASQRLGVETPNTMNQHRTNKLILTTVMFLGAFMVCWLPFMTFEFVLLLIIQNGNNVHDEIIETEQLFQKYFLVDKFFNSLMMTYPLIDPIIYAARIPAVQQCIFMWISSTMPCFSRWAVRFLTKHNQQLMSARASLRTMGPLPLDQLFATSIMATTSTVISPVMGERVIALPIETTKQAIKASRLYIQRQKSSASNDSSQQSANTQITRLITNNNVNYNTYRQYKHERLGRRRTTTSCTFYEDA